MKNFESIIEVVGEKEDREATYAWPRPFWPPDRIIWPEENQKVGLLNGTRLARLDTAFPSSVHLELTRIFPRCTFEHIKAPTQL
jgi:hypothetical protein